MDAHALLRDVSEAYRRLKTLAIEASVVSESGDENANNRSEHRVRFLYAAPNRLRHEPLGERGVIQVLDGEHVHGLFRSPGGPRYSRTPVSGTGPLPCQFRPEFPGLSGTFLFQNIHERIAAAEFLRDENGCHVVSVTYEPPPHPGLTIGSPVEYWIDAKSRMVVRQSGEIGHRRPASDETLWSRHTTIVRSIRIDQQIPDDAFRFTPPSDAVEMGGGNCGVSVSGGSGFIEAGADGSKRLEFSGSHEWQGQTLVERGTWKIRGIALKFERRLTFTDDGKEVRIQERVTGPRGEDVADLRLPLDDQSSGGERR